MPNSQLHISAHEQFHTQALQDDFQPKFSMAFPWEDKCPCLVQLNEKERHRVCTASSLSLALCQSQELNLSDETLATPNGSPSTRPLLSQPGFKLCCICFVCSALASTGLMLTAATTLSWKTKSLWSSRAAAAGPSKAMLMDLPSFVCLNLHPRKTFQYKVILPDWLRSPPLWFVCYFQFWSLLVITVP